MVGKRRLGGEVLREQLAQEAARLVVDHGMHDYGQAKRKAAQRFGIRESSALPSNSEIESSVVERGRATADIRPGSPCSSTDDHAEACGRHHGSIEWVRAAVGRSRVDGYGHRKFPARVARLYRFARRRFFRTDSACYQHPRLPATLPSKRAGLNHYSRVPLHERRRACLRYHLPGERLAPGAHESRR